MSKAAPATVAAQSSERRRYPGGRSFEERDWASFFGRTRATEELLLRVLSVRLLLQFAPSGVGKTSLLNAGLFPKLRVTHFFPFSIRLNEEKETLTEAVRRSLREAANKQGLQAPVIPENTNSLWDLLEGTELWNPDLLLLVPVLVFDQFEEIFTLRDEAFRKGFAREIGELSMGRKLTDHGSSVAPDVKIIISLREEYLGKLEELAAGIPDLFHERLRLAPLSGEEAKGAMVKPAGLEGDTWYSPGFEFDPPSLDALIDFIDGTSEKIKVVESLTLQLVCQRAEEIARQRGAQSGPIILRLEDFGGLAGLNRLVRSYFETELARLHGVAAKKRARDMFEQGLLDPNGKRLMLEEGEIARSYGLDTPALDQLVDSRLLRREPRNESVFYEITHDRFAEAIAKNRKRKLPQWVKPTIAAGVAVILLVLWFAYRANDAKSQAQTALGVLLGDELTSRLREAGLTDALQDVLKNANIDSESKTFAFALSRRHEGDILVARGTVKEAQRKFDEALDVLNALLASEAKPVFIAERARVLKRIGSLFEDIGEVSRAEQSYKESIEAWDQLLKNNSRPQEKLDVSETWNSLGNVQNRMGNAETAGESYTKALNLALDVLTGAYDRAQTGDPGVFFERGRAMQIYADSVLYLTSVWGGEPEAQSAHALARESLRLRPLSSAARLQVGAASARYGLEAFNSPTPNAEFVAKKFRESSGQFDELNQWDPYNRRMQRESASVQLLIAEGTVSCAAKPACKKTLLPNALEDADLISLDSIGHFRMLAGLDHDNRQLNQDVVWGLRARAKVLDALGNPSAGLALLDEALAVANQSTVDPKDIDGLLRAPDLHSQKAGLLERVRRPQDALAAFDEALAKLSRLPDNLSVVRVNRYNITFAKIELLRRLNRAADAAKLDAENQQLRKLMGDPWDDRRDRALKINDEGVAFFESAVLLKGVAAIAEFRRAVEKYQASIEQYPFQSVYWDNLRNAYQHISSIQKELEESAGTTPDAKKSIAAEHESALRGAVTAAWMGRVLSPEENLAEAWRLQYVTRLELDQFLSGQERTEEVLPLVAQEVLDAEEYARQQPQSADALFLLADANVGLGMVRFQSKYDGWEEALRKGLAYGTQLARKEPAKAEHQRWIGDWRRSLGDFLVEAGRNDAAVQEFNLALAACRSAAALGRTKEELAAIQVCLDTLALQGYK